MIKKIRIGEDEGEIMPAEEGELIERMFSLIRLGWPVQITYDDMGGRWFQLRKDLVAPEVLKRAEEEYGLGKEFH